jgi:hypothetical protein
VSLALAAVDMALWDLNCKRARIAPPCRGRRPTSHTDLQYRWKLAQFHDWGACRRCDRGAGRGFDASMSFGRMCGGPSALWSRPRRPAMFATCICPWAPESWRSTIAMIVRPFRVEVTERSRSTCSLGFLPAALVSGARGDANHNSWKRCATSDGWMRPNSATNRLSLSIV